MAVTIVLALIMMALLFLMIWSATYFLPWSGLMEFFPEDIRDKAAWHKPPFPGAPRIGWICLILCAAGMAGVILYAGWDGIQRGYTFKDFLIRFLVIFVGIKAFDIIALDYFLITKSHFFQHYFPETEGCEGYHRFGYNKNQQIPRVIAMPFLAMLAAWICTKL